MVKILSLLLQLIQTLVLRSSFQNFSFGKMMQDVSYWTWGTITLNQRFASQPQHKSKDVVRSIDSNQFMSVIFPLPSCHQWQRAEVSSGLPALPGRVQGWAVRSLCLPAVCTRDIQTIPCTHWLKDERIYYFFPGEKVLLFVWTRSLRFACI